MARRRKNPKHYGKNATIGAVIGGVLGGIYQHWRESPRYVARWTDLVTAGMAVRSGESSFDAEGRPIPISIEQISASADRADRMDFWHEVVQGAVIGAIGGVAYTGVKS